MPLLRFDYWSVLTKLAFMGKETTPNLGKFHRFRALFIVVRHMFYSRSHGIAPHQPSIEGLQQAGRRELGDVSRKPRAFVLRVPVLCDLRCVPNVCHGIEDRLVR